MTIPHTWERAGANQQQEAEDTQTRHHQEHPQPGPQTPLGPLCPQGMLYLHPHHLEEHLREGYQI